MKICMTKFNDEKVFLTLPFLLLHITVHYMWKSSTLRGLGVSFSTLQVRFRHGYVHEKVDPELIFTNLLVAIEINWQEYGFDCNSFF